jgi:8-oxo-dGTP pyrophosphatase MutT (NUDIX family)
MAFYICCEVLMPNLVTELSPWKTISTRHIYENPWISVREDQVIQPSGGKGIYGVVHLRNLAIGILPIDDNEYVHLVGQFRYTLNAYSWEIPQGGCFETADPAKRENPLDTAKRELLEETGLIARQWQEMGRSHLSNCVSDELAIMFLAKSLEMKKAEPEETEQFTYKHIPFDDALNMVLKGEITDSMSVIAIMRYQLIRKGYSI